MRKLKIGYIGNFIPPFSTENDRKWSFEQLGHEVIPFQENQTTHSELLEAMETLDVLFYSHTHDPAYVIPHLKDVFAEYESKNVPTASVHLDRWVGLKREEDVGKEATWYTKYIFMADGSPEAVELYNKHHLNWFYLPAGVIMRDCRSLPKDNLRFPHEIIFVGSKGYHPEYPFRSELIDFLKAEYGSRFGHYGNDGLGVMRGHDLNTLYSTARIAVGDSCFAGTPNYVSDRYYETRGRGGFLLHPKVEGVDDIGVGHYRQGDLEDLKVAIDFWLDNSYERELMREAGQLRVIQSETYTHRAATMLNKIFSN